jgi:biotin operon repressor
LDEQELAEDLRHASDAGRAAIEPVIEQLRADGVPVEWLKRCDAEAQDGTRLPGCVKLYIPPPEGGWGAVLLGGSVAGGPKLFLLAVGERHPGAPWRLSVYEIAHRRLQARPSNG